MTEKLPPAVKDRLESAYVPDVEVELVETSPKIDLSDRRVRHYLVMVPDGEQPELYTFSKPADLAEFLHKHHNDDIYAFSITGILQPFTHGPVRFIQFMDGTYFELSPRCQPAEKPSPAPPLQEDFFLGPPELVFVPAPVKKAKAAKPDKEGFDDEDNAEGAAV